MVDEQSMESILRTIRELAARQEAMAADQSRTIDPRRHPISKGQTPRERKIP
jgi:hypothetical protein